MLSFAWRSVYTLLCLELSKRRSLLVKPSSRAARFSSRGCLSPRSAVGLHGLLRGDAAAGGQPSAEDTARPPWQAPHSHPRRRDLPVRFKSFATALAYIFFFMGHLCKMHTHFLLLRCLLPPPTSEDFGSRLVQLVPVSSSHPGERSLAAQLPSSREPGGGSSWENYRKIK